MKFQKINEFDLNEEISKSWGENVLIRGKDLEEGTDYSYLNVIMPWVLKKVKDCAQSDSRILDVGCGCGFLTNEIYKNGFRDITGVDISKMTIEYAEKRYPAVSFICEDINCYIPDKKYDLCLVVMTANNICNINDFFVSLKKLLVKKGRVIFINPHPVFWPIHHLKVDSYYYLNENVYKYNFSTKGRKDYLSPVFYFHRTLTSYLTYIREAGFQIIDFLELADCTSQEEPDILAMEMVC